jgi:SAM-dependent methyltransferase
VLSFGILFYTAVLVVLFGSAAVAGLSAAPYLPTRWKDVRRALDLAQVRAGETVCDLGCGDGRFLVAAARRGAHAVGYEISLLPFLWAWARVLMARISGTPGTASVRFRSIYRADIAAADVVVCFLTPMAMSRLSTKITRELKPGARLLSVAFHLPGFEPVANDHPTKNAARIFLYRRG